MPFGGPRPKAIGVRTAVTNRGHLPFRGSRRHARWITRVILAAAIAAGLAFAGPGRAENVTLVGTVGPDYTISLTLNGSPVGELDPGTYTIVVHDNASMHDFHVYGPGVDELTGVEFVGDVTWTLTFEAGASYRFICDPHEDVMSGTFSVRSTPVPSPPPAPTEANLVLQSFDRPDVLTAGEQITYTHSVANHGPADATGVSLSVQLPDGVTLASATTTQGTCSGAARMDCALGGLANGGSATVTIVVTTAVAGSLVERASVTAAQPDPSPGDNATVDTATVVVASAPPPPPSADLVVDVGVAADGVRVGDNVYYTLTVTNRGPDRATGVLLEDRLPTQAMLVEATTPNGVCRAGLTLACDLGSLERNGVATARVVVKPTAAGELASTVWAYAPQLDPEPANNRAESKVAVAPAHVGVTAFAVHAALRAGRPSLSVRIDVDEATPATLLVRYHHETAAHRSLHLQPGSHILHVMLPRDARHSSCIVELRFTDAAGRQEMLRRTLRLR